MEKERRLKRGTKEMNIHTQQEERKAGCISSPPKKQHMVMFQIPNSHFFPFSFSAIPSCMHQVCATL